MMGKTYSIIINLENSAVSEMLYIFNTKGSTVSLYPRIHNII